MEKHAIKIKYFSNEVPRLHKIDKGDWVDLYSAIDLNIEAGKQYLIPLGVAMELPLGYEANVVPRSSTFKNWGLLQTNSFAVVDEAYKGDNDQWFWPVYSTRDTIITIGDKVCQFRINKKQPEIYFVEVNSLENKDRGGFGTTGTR